MRTFAVIHNIPSPYRIFLFGAMQGELERRGISFHVHFMSRGHGERPTSWRNPEIPFAHTFWPERWPGAGERGYHFNPGMLAGLRREPQPDFLLVGSAWSSPTGALASLLAPRRTGIAWIEANTKTPGRIRGAAAFLKRLILRRFQYVAVPGREGMDYLEMLQSRKTDGLPRPVLLPNLVDEHLFRSRTACAAEEISRIRRMLGILPEQRFMLCVARLSPEKGVLEFIRQLTPELMGHWVLVVVGGGPLVDQARKLIQEQKLTDCVRLQEGMGYASMPALYSAADLFVLPSPCDRNPLSVIEAMHSGLPILLSDRVGNLPEALEDGVNGWQFDPASPDAVRRGVARALSATPGQLCAMGECSKRRATYFWNTPMAIRRFLDSVGAV